MHAAAEALAWSYMTAGRHKPANMPCSGYPLVIAILSTPFQTQTCRAHHVWHVVHVVYGMSCTSCMACRTHHVWHMMALPGGICQRCSSSREASWAGSHSCRLLKGWPSTGKSSAGLLACAGVGGAASGGCTGLKHLHAGHLQQHQVKNLQLQIVTTSVCRTFFDHICVENDDSGHQRYACRWSRNKAMIEAEQAY